MITKTNYTIGEIFVFMDEFSRFSIIFQDGILPCNKNRTEIRNCVNKYLLKLNCKIYPYSLSEENTGGRSIKDPPPRKFTAISELSSAFTIILTLIRTKSKY